MDKETLEHIGRICEIILGNRFQNSELDGLALHVGHHPDVLNPKEEPDYKSLLKRCLPTISYMADVSDEVAQLLVEIKEAIK
jgi:hypothetical protein